MTFEEKLEIVSKNYADKYIENVDVKSLVHKAYYEGFKVGYKKASSQCQPQVHGLWRKANNLMQCDICFSQFNLANWEFCPVCGTCMDGIYN